MTKIDGSEPVRDMAKSVISDPPSSVEGLNLAPLALPCEATDALNQISAQMPTSEMNEDQIKHADFRYAYDEMIRIARSGLRVALAPPREVTEAIEKLARKYDQDVANLEDMKARKNLTQYGKDSLDCIKRFRDELRAALNAPARVDRP